MPRKQDRRQAPASTDATLLKTPTEDAKAKIDCSTVAGMAEWVQAASPEEVRAVLTTLPAEMQAKILRLALEVPVAEAKVEDKVEVGAAPSAEAAAGESGAPLADAKVE